MLHDQLGPELEHGVSRSLLPKIADLLGDAASRSSGRLGRDLAKRRSSFAWAWVQAKKSLVVELLGPGCAIAPFQRPAVAASVGVAGGLALGQQLAQHVVEDAAVAVVVDLVERVDPAEQA